MEGKIIRIFRHETLGELKIIRGFDNDLLPQLLEYTHTDPSIEEYTSDTKRFADKNAYEKWQRKKRSMYVLADAANGLLGIIWFGKRELPLALYDKEYTLDEFTITFSIRIYGKARGKKIAKIFAQSAMEDFMEQEEYTKSSKKGLWLAVVETNIPAIKLYTQLGFSVAGKSEEERELIMVRK